MKRILVIEDNPDNLLLVHMLLSPLKVHLRTAQDGPSGIEAAQAETFDLILLDIQLPGMDGYQVVKALRALPALADTPSWPSPATPWPATAKKPCWRASRNT